MFSYKKFPITLIYIIIYSNMNSIFGDLFQYLDWLLMNNLDKHIDYVILHRIFARCK